jgi:hypothetical protein
LRRFLGLALLAVGDLFLLHLALDGLAFAFQALRLVAGFQVFLARFVAAGVDQKFLVAGRRFLFQRFCSRFLERLALGDQGRGLVQARRPVGLPGGIRRRLGQGSQRQPQPDNQAGKEE